MVYPFRGEMTSIGEEEKRHAFTVKLGMRVSTSGRQSQADCIQNVKVTHQTLVSYFFELGAFLFRAVHGRDRSELEKDYDVCLIQESGELILHPKREISHYNIRKDDILEICHKALPIMMTINLWEGQEKSIKVYSGAPVMDITPAVCKELGIEEDAEMSLAYPIIKVKDHTPCLRWLDPVTSLSSQGVADGDTLLLRKKFFILNDDVNEALERNSMLKELLYQQAHHHHTSGACRVSSMELNSIFSQLGILFNHIEDVGGDMSASLSTVEILSKFSQGDDKNIEQIMEACRLQQSVKVVPKDSAKSSVLQLVTQPSVTLVTYFPVRMQSSSEEMVLAVSNDSVSVCEVNEAGHLKVIPDKSWRLKDIRESCQQTEQMIRINTLGYWQELFTKYAAELSNYISESERISRKKALKQRSSVYNAALAEPHLSQELPPLVEHTTDEVTTMPSDAKNSPSITDDMIVVGPSKQEYSLHPNTTSDVITAINQTSTLSNPNQATEVCSTSQRQSVGTTASMDAASNGSYSVEAISRESMSLDMSASGFDIVQKSWLHMHISLTSNSPVKAAGISMEAAMSLDANVTKPMGMRDKSTPCSETSVISPAESLPQKSASPKKSSSAGPSDQGTIYQWPTIEERSPHKRPFNVVYSPAKSKQSKKEQHTRHGSQVSRTESMKSKTSQKSSSEFIYIPKYLSLDYREILEQHRLFHVVVMDKDIRPLLLDITTSVKEAIEVICGTFGICNPENYYLAIPPGIQSIVEKYGGRPKSLIGRFKKSEHSMKNFASRLDGTKTLQNQYDYNIQPFILHLRRFKSDDEDIDSSDMSFGNCGEEWPKSEHHDVARYRKFYQGWIGVVQGAYPVTRDRAVQLAAYLTGVYFEKKTGKPWPPRDYEPKVFLPEQYRNASGIVSEVIETYRAVEGVQVLECINKVIDLCSVQQGVFFEVSIPTTGDMIPTKRMKKVLLGVSHCGLFTVERDTGMVHGKRDLTQIHNWACSDNSFHLDFKIWGEPFYGYTYQTKEVIDTLKMYLDVAKRRKIMEEFELERTREELLRLGHLDEEEKKIDLSLPPGHENNVQQHLSGEKDNINELKKIAEQKKSVQQKFEPVILHAGNEAPVGKRLSTLSILSPLSLDMELELLTPLRV